MSITDQKLKETFRQEASGAKTNRIEGLNAKASSMRKPALFTPHGTTNKTYTCMGLSKDHSIKRYKLILRNGSCFNLPYALLPIIKLETEDSLKILMSGVTINISGRGMSVIEGFLFEERIVWMKEHPSLIDDQSQDLYIHQIWVHGDEI